MSGKNEPATKLDPWAIAGSAYASVVGDFGWFLRTTWAWVVVAALVIAFRESFIPEDLHWAWLAPEILVYLLAGSSIAVAWHRRLLLHERPAPVYYLRLGRRELRFFWRLLGLMVGVILIPGFVMMFVLFFAFYFAGFLSDPAFEHDPGFFLLAVGTMVATTVPWLLGVRLLPALSAVAVENADVSLAQSWRAARGNTWRFWLALMLATTPANGICVAIASLREEAPVWLL